MSANPISAHGTLAGHDGCEYTSPPQARPDALALVAVLLGGATHATNGITSWTCAIAGGRRMITLNGYERPAA